ncbi:MAG TPA: 16S rRNA (cytosine(1402)-N(4))-methyltransferase RsmH [Phycisphaerales bacterium]|nr:16S rRNA (cytosine(1402)-N(4))-methyltransferase RsmH [Phycisphaerales bacterium]
MLGEVMEWLVVEPDDFIVDMTLGGGGYSRAILDELGKEGKLVSFDRDIEAVERARGLFSDEPRLTIHHAPFSQSAEFIALHSPVGHDGAVFDLGVSSHQLDEAERGFSFQQDGPLDMRMNPDSDAESAADFVNNRSVQELTEIFRDFGEERKARAVARAIEKRRETQPYTRTLDLAQTIESVVGRPRPSKFKKAKHPATRCFQALRIAVNQELDELRIGLDNALNTARPGARVAVVSYHSLEDRIVKNYFRDKAGRCHCPRHQPVCTCGAKAEINILTKKAVKPSEQEVEENRRSRSAVLRVVEKI